MDTWTQHATRNKSLSGGIPTGTRMHLAAVCKTRTTRNTSHDARAHAHALTSCMLSNHSSRELCCNTLPSMLSWKKFKRMLIDAGSVLGQRPTNTPGQLKMAVGQGRMVRCPVLGGVMTGPFSGSIWPLSQKPWRNRSLRYHRCYVQ